MNTVYINKNTNNIVDPNSIISYSEDDIIVNNSNCWQLIPHKDLEKQKIYTEYFPEENVPTKYERTEQYAFYTDNLQYHVGFADFVVCTRKPAESSGIVSKEISVDNVSYLTVTGDVIGDGSVEYWILDGANEIPLLPENSNTVYKEKLFCDLNTETVTTRFPIDQVQGIKPVLYEDNIALNKDYKELQPEDFNNHIYYLTYTAAGNSQKYIPYTNKVRLKIIVRQYTNEPVFVKHIMLHKYGGSVLWISNLSD